MAWSDIDLNLIFYFCFCSSKHPLQEYKSSWTPSPRGFMWGGVKLSCYEVYYIIINKSLTKNTIYLDRNYIVRHQNKKNKQIKIFIVTKNKILYYMNYA